MYNKKLFSAIQPSGNITIGNYIGTIKHWLLLQNQYECTFCIADLHSLTNIKNQITLSKSTLDVLSLYLACGINPNKSTIFVQSHIEEHVQLSWILGCYVYFSDLHNMIQFKQRYVKNKKLIGSGIFNYPILMASDILLYNTNYVSIGIDQKQHIEFTRNIAKRFNKINGNIFTIPNSIIPEYGSKIMSLLHPNKKMSKSDNNKNNVISLLENPNNMYQKINHAITDSNNPPKIIYDPKKKPGISNLLSIIHGITNISIKKLEKKFKNYTYENFKKKVSYLLYHWLYSFQKKFYKIRNNKKYLKKVFIKGKQKAKKQAQKMYKKVSQKIGFLNI